MKRCSNCDGIIKETAAVITTYIHPGEAGAVQWKVINSKYDIEKAKRVHGDKYDYSKVEYVNTATKVCIICPEHGEFW